MRVSRQQAEANRQAVVDNASRLFRERGVNGIGLAELMDSVGLTHGAFYGQFASRDDLVRQALARALEVSRQKLASRLLSAEVAPLDKLVRSYLSTQHRDDLGNGCPFTTLGSDVARGKDDELKEIFQREVKAYLQMIEGVLPATTGKAREDEALVVLSTLIGAMTLSRLLTGTPLSDRVLNAAATALMEDRE